ncbi:MAG: integron [Pseudomonadota bacterium]
MRLAACLVALSMTVATPAIAQPVMVGGESDYDACGSVGKVVGLNPNGDNYLSVRAEASSKGRELDRLGPETNVFMCDQRGRWIGVVYGSGCGVGSPIPQRKAYNGPCRSGWVFKKYIQLIAG